MRRVLLILASLVALQQLLGATLWRGQLWGTHSYGYLPVWLGLVALAGFLWASWRFARHQGAVPVPEIESMGKLRGALSLLAAGAVFWMLRIRHDLLGDALPLTHDLPRGIETHPRQPLTMWLQQKLYQLLGPIFQGEGVDPAEVATSTVAVGSVFCGVAALFLFWKISRWLAPAGTSQGERMLFSLILAMQGSALLFYGYLENYSIYYLGVALYLFCALAFLRRRLPLVAAGVSLALLLGLHLSSFVLWPSFLLLLAVGLRDARRRIAAMRDLGLTLGSVLLVGWFLNRVDPEFHLQDAFLELVQLGRGYRGLSYLLSLAHLRDWFEEQLLAGPVTVLFWLPAAIYWFRSHRRDETQNFLLLAAVTGLAASFLADEPLLGYARDWDLFLPVLLPVTLSALALGWHAAATSDESRPAMGYVALVSIIATIPWVLLNLSESRSLTRMAELPLGLGRSAVVVGNWHLRQGDAVTAQTWFERALEEYPANNTAMSLLGNIALQRGDPDRALALYERAIELRPRKIEYRERITRVLIEQGRPAECAPHFEALLRERPGDGTVWLRYAQTLREAGQPEAATQCYRRAAIALKEQQLRRPRDYQLNMDLGTVHASLGEADVAEEHLRVALALRPESAAALYQLAGVLVSMGRQAEAKPYLQRLLQVSPNHPQREAIEQWISGGP